MGSSEPEGRTGQMTGDARVNQMASGMGTVAGVAVRPVMDLSDRRVIAYQASPRTAGGEASPAALLDAALSLATSASPAPLLVHVDPGLLVSPTFDPIAHARAAKCAPSEVVWMLPEPRRGMADEPDPPEARILAAAVRRNAAILPRGGLPGGPRRRGRAHRVVGGGGGREAGVSPHGAGSSPPGPSTRATRPRSPVSWPSPGGWGPASSLRA